MGCGASNNNVSGIDPQPTNSWANNNHSNYSTQVGSNSNPSTFQSSRRAHNMISKTIIRPKNYRHGSQLTQVLG